MVSLQAQLAGRWSGEIALQPVVIIEVVAECLIS